MIREDDDNTLDNVICRTPARNAQNLELVKSEILEMVDRVVSRLQPTIHIENKQLMCSVTRTRNLLPRLCMLTVCIIADYWLVCLILLQWRRSGTARLCSQALNRPVMKSPSLDHSGKCHSVLTNSWYVDHIFVIARRHCTDV